MSEAVEKSLREKVLELRGLGKSLLEISKELDVVKSTVFYHLSADSRDKVRQATKRKRLRDTLKKEGKPIPEELQLRTSFKENIFFCKRCRKEKVYTKTSSNTYCSSTCSSKHRKELLLERWKSGEELGYKIGKNGGYTGLKSAIREHILQKVGYSCQECGFNKVHPLSKTHILNIDHIDGDCTNCNEDNLRVLCPNCHAMTPTFGARNKNSKREYCIRLRKDTLQNKETIIN